MHDKLEKSYFYGWIKLNLLRVILWEKQDIQ